MQADAILRTRRGRYLIPRDVPRRAEMLAGTAVALLAVHILVAQLTGVIAVACYLTGRVTRWRLSWLAVPAAIGALWALAVGPSAAAAGLTAGPAHVLSTLGPNFGLTAAGSARAGPLRLQAAFSGAGSWLPRQLPLALITGPAEAAVAGWLDWLHTDSWAAAPARPGLFAVVRRALNIRALRTGAALARDAVVLGVNPATGARVSVPWREVAGGALVTGSASGEVAATAFRFVLTALGRRKPVIEVGDLESRRDWTDTRDMVRAYWLATERGEPGEVYNVGRGTCMAVGDMLDTLLSQSHVTIAKEQDPSRMRPSDVRLLWANVDKFKQATDWEPKIAFDQTMADLLGYWRERVRILGRQPVGTR